MGARAVMLEWSDTWCRSTEVMMLIAGIVLVAVAIALIAAATTGNGHSVKVDIFGIVHPHLSISTIFLGGIVTTVIAVVGVFVLIRGMKASRRSRKENKRVAKDKKQAPAQIESSGAIDFTKPIDFDKIGQPRSNNPPS